MIRSLRVLPLSTALLLAAAVVAQGQTLTFGVSPGQTTTGAASGGGSGQLGVVVGGFGTVPVSVPPGTPSTGVAAAIASALQAQGFAATQNGTEVTITAGPGGAPLTQGGGIGSTDTGVTGVRARVDPGAPPGLKPNGVNIPKAQPAAQANQPGSIQVDVDVLKLIGGVWTPLHIQVVVPVQPGDTGDAVNDRVRQELEAQGLRVQDIQLPSNVAPITPTPSFGLDRTDDGGKVQGVEVQPQGGARQLLPKNQAGAGQVPAFGATDYDRGLFTDGFESGNSSAWTGDARVGQGGALESFTAPNQFGLWIVTPGQATPQFLPPVVPLPFVSPQMYLPLDPFAGLLLFDITSPLGTMQLPLPIPPDPLLVGLELQSVALTLDPLAPDLFGSMQRTNGVVVRVGP